MKLTKLFMDREMTFKELIRVNGDIYDLEVAGHWPQLDQKEHNNKPYCLRLKRDSLMDELGIKDKKEDDGETN